jgi:uncharacterized caspase-like protein
MSRKALVVGIDYYDAPSAQLFGCVNDAHAVNQVLQRHSDGSPNFDAKLLTATDEKSKISRKALKDCISELFKGDSEIALFYFAGHGHIEATGGYLLTSDANEGDEGLPLTDLLQIAFNSKAKNKVIVLDSCHSGKAGNPSLFEDKSILSEGMTILTASGQDEYATEKNGSGVFTTLFVDALNGGAANLLGDITPGSIYAHIDQSLGEWDQRPVFKTNIKRFTSLRSVEPPIQRENLRKIVEYFNQPSVEFKLDPSFEPQPPAPNHGIAPDPINTAKFAVLQQLVRLNLVKPVGEDHMYFAAMNSKSCKLTALGAHYWNLISNGRV